MNDQSTTDQSLAIKVRQDSNAFILLYQRHIRRIYAYHLARTNNDQDAQDLTSETFLAALDHLATYRPQYSFVAWLMGIAHHKLIDFYRGRPAALSLDVIPDPPAADPSPEKQAAHQADLNRVRQIISLLTVERADALSLRYFGGLSLAETAQVMGKSEAAVKMLVMRALEELRDRLGAVVLEEL
jgi:RNA polymerase sigma-70 factor (ECF subfamily)